MMMIPTAILSIWGGGILSVAIIAGGIYLAREWYIHAWILDRDLNRYVFYPHLGWNTDTAILAGAVALLTLAVLGGPITRAVLSLMGSSGKAGDRPEADHEGEKHRLRRPDGTELHVEVLGPQEGPVVVLTHGWGVDGTEWSYVKRQLGKTHRLIVWDLPGMGRSKGPDNGDYSLETMARDLDAVLGLAGGRPAVLAGHSIGGMTTLTFCRLFPEALGSRVAGLALVHTSYTNPVRTTRNAPFYTAIEKPVIVPLLHVTIALSPLVWVMNWLSYWNGSAHRSTKRSGFGGTETPGQVDFVARFQVMPSPATLARGMFGMLAYDATHVLPTIGIPTLVIPGDRDPVCLPEAHEFIAREVPGARLSPLSPAKHMGHFEHHAEFADRLGAFATMCCEGVRAASV